jgi:hypothetical protein
VNQAGRVISQRGSKTAEARRASNQKRGVRVQPPRLETVGTELGGTWVARESKKHVQRIQRTSSPGDKNRTTMKNGKS